MPKDLRILYHYHHYNPKTEAVAQEIELLKNHFDGRLFLARTNRTALNTLRIKLIEKRFDLHHIYHPTLVLRNFLKRYIYRLKKPVILSIVTDPFTAGGQKRVERELGKIKTVAAIAVSDEKSKLKLQSLGLKNVCLARTGIRMNLFREFPSRSDPVLKLVMASSPHSEEGFEPKGILILFEALRAVNDIRVFFLWRGKLSHEFWRYVDKYGVRDKVELINEPVNVNLFLKDKHGVITPYLTLASNKAYPHSLIDGLASGKAVLTSDAVPISHVVREERCGVVFKPAVELLIKKIEVFRSNFVEMSKNARATAEKYFSEEAFVECYDSIYREVTERHENNCTRTKPLG